jgi:hypothetical protein
LPIALRESVALASHVRSITQGLCRHIEVVSTLRDNERSVRREGPSAPRRQGSEKAGIRVAPPTGSAIYDSV